MRMILVNVVMRLGRRKIMNDMKREMIKLKGVNMMMQNMVMVWKEEIPMLFENKGLSGKELNAIL